MVTPMAGLINLLRIRIRTEWAPLSGFSPIRRFASFRHVLATLHTRPHSSLIVKPQPNLQILAIPPA